MRSDPRIGTETFIYGMALDDGLIHPASLLQDVPKTGDYRPGNFDSGFHGPVSMSEALVRSLTCLPCRCWRRTGLSVLPACSATQGCRLFCLRGRSQICR